ncbi:MULTISPECIES: hypothetical protein [Staphylococcus]|uniref:hypothetical protein n=1 Tax=Staphylococcus TaxID=1279 RepID=UPI00066A9191|nr:MULTISPECIES: hypothetical protein [Staphylococcus]MBA9941581.1 hypothetical protein [Ralstonia insidiosa]AXE41474.1 hypothetical protein DQW72_06330 [Staphylococcus epidermidis]KAA9310781.1 hypothetical protein F6I04_01065 [Staphylococcus epidermidis]KAA9319153.1 hypothetical protein F6H98_00460 [Staphylococcus epidermidis]KAB2180015.1 hypothetical protein F9B26_02845 [Staphylococcus epidermidis]
MKKLILIVGASSLLMGCGSQNLAPLEDKTTELRDDNHQLKLDIQELNQEIGEHKSKIAALKQDKENTKEASSNKLKIKNLKASSDYYDSIAKAIKDYRDIESKVNKNNNKVAIQRKLDDILNDIDGTFIKYKESVDSESQSEEDKKKEKEIRQLNKDLSSAFNTIKKGYETKDNKKIEKGQKKLATINTNLN